MRQVLVVRSVVVKFGYQVQVLRLLQLLKVLDYFVQLFDFGQQIVLGVDLIIQLLLQDAVLKRLGVEVRDQVLLDVLNFLISVDYRLVALLELLDHLLNLLDLLLNCAGFVLLGFHGSLPVLQLG